MSGPATAVWDAPLSAASLFLRFLDARAGGLSVKPGFRDCPLDR
jgi:hypothetical protein